MINTIIADLQSRPIDSLKRFTKTSYSSLSCSFPLTKSQPFSVLWFAALL